MSLRGYCRTLSARMACSPAMRMTRLTTMASTGRLMNRSVNFIKLSRLLSPDRSVVFRLGSAIVGRLDRVLDADGGAVAQLEDAGADDLGPGLHAREHRDLVSHRAAQLHHLLARAAVAL